MNEGMKSSDSPKRPPDKHGVVALIEDTAGRLLFIRRGWQLQRAPGVWCFVGGEIERGESHQQAIEREVFEEVGLHVQALDKIHESLSPNEEFRLHWMRVKLLDSAQPLRLHAVEVAEACWLTLQEAAALDPVLPALKAWLLDQVNRKQASSEQ